ncbi:hypothetical protein [Cohnella nanjingensis]|uniref:hypothetical protein n=1 Tax=Cohnella nanjingensis TaxID=1387779 RepID=UPI001C886E55|nr:hypothetical protein [Cohnella nanjingensis]
MNGKPDTADDDLGSLFRNGMLGSFVKQDAYDNQRNEDYDQYAAEHLEPETDISKDAPHSFLWRWNNPFTL